MATWIYRSPEEAADLIEIEMISAEYYVCSDRLSYHRHTHTNCCVLHDTDTGEYTFVHPVSLRYYRCTIDPEDPNILIPAGESCKNIKIHLGEVEDSWTELRLSSNYRAFS